MYRTKEKPVQDFILRTIQSTPPDVIQVMLQAQMVVGEAIWQAAYDQAMQDHKVGPYAVQERQ
jgi:hypothetical protein